MQLSANSIREAAEIAKAAVSSGERAGYEALTHPDEVAKLIEVVATKIQEIATAE